MCIYTNDDRPELALRPDTHPILSANPLNAAATALKPDIVEEARKSGLAP
jgi:hypothetical protein